MGQCILWAKKLLHISNIRPEITIGCLHKSVCGIDMRGSVFWQWERGVFGRELGTTANLELGTTAGCIPFALPLPFPHPPPSALESRNKISAISLQCKLYIIRPWRIPATRHDLNFFFLPEPDPEFFFRISGFRVAAIYAIISPGFFAPHPLFRNIQVINWHKYKESTKNQWKICQQPVHLLRRYISK